MVAPRPSDLSAHRSPVMPAKKAKRKISAEGMRRIIEANKRRWAAKRAEAAKVRSVVAKKAVVKKAATK